MNRYLRAILRAGVGCPAWPGDNLRYRLYQSPPELEALCGFIDGLGLRSYLEIGLGLGGTWRLLTEILGLSPSCGITLEDKLRAVPAGGKLCVADSSSAKALRFAKQHGPFDFIFVDGDHDHEAVLADFRRYAPLGRYVGFHDITGLYNCEGSRTSWEVIATEAQVMDTFIDEDWPVGIGIVRGGVA